MDSRNVELDDLGDVVRMLGREISEERPHPLRDGLEEEQHLVGPFEAASPPVFRPNGHGVDARGEATPERASAQAIGQPGGRGRQDHAHRPGRVNRVHRVGAHAPTLATARPLEKSSVVTPRSERSTTAPWAGTGEMFRIRWYSVSACQVDALSNSTPWYWSTP